MCQGLTQQGEQCKRKGEPMCQQHELIKLRCENCKLKELVSDLRKGMHLSLEDINEGVVKRSKEIISINKQLGKQLKEQKKEILALNKSNKSNAMTFIKQAFEISNLNDQVGLQKAFNNGVLKKKKELEALLVKYEDVIQHQKKEIQSLNKSIERKAKQIRSEEVISKFKQLVIRAVHHSTLKSLRDDYIAYQHIKKFEKLRTKMMRMTKMKKPDHLQIICWMKSHIEDAKQLIQTNDPVSEYNRLRRIRNKLSHA